MNAIVLTATFKGQTGFVPCELWKHITGTLYAIAPGSCAPINCEFESVGLVEL